MSAGLFSLLGTASAHAGTHIPLAFLLGAIAASFSVYSYAKLGATFPSSGGAATFTIMSFGPGIISGGLNIFQYIAYLIAAALYAAGFSEYANTLLGGHLSPLEVKLIGAGIVILCAGINLLGTSIVGKVETLAIGFVTLALFGTGNSRRQYRRISDVRLVDSWYCYCRRHFIYQLPRIWSGHQFF